MSDSAHSRGPRQGGFRHGLLRALLGIALVAGGLALYAQGAPARGMATGAGPALYVLFACLLFSTALISAAETAIFSLDKLDISQLRGSRDLSARFIVRLIDRPNDALVTMMILNNFMNLCITLTVAALTERVFGSAEAQAFTAAAVVATLSILLFGEIIPKMFAHAYARLASRVLAPLLVAASWVLWPIIRLVNLVLGGLYRILHIPETPPAEEVSEEELKVMINSGEVSSVLEQDELEMIDGIFDLRHTTIEQILTPRIGVEAFPDTIEQEELVARLRKTIHNRVLIYRESLDHLVGFLLVKEILLEPEVPWRTRVREALCVPEQMRLLDMLGEFRRKRMRMAVAVDEYGGVAGIVTLQDLLEEIVGDIYEKHEPQMSPVQPAGPGHWLLNGSLSLGEAGEKLGVQFPERRGHTLGGFMMNTLGRIPAPGEEVVYENIKFIVREMSARRVQTVEAVRQVPDERRRALAEEARG